uniref:Uncharacterized protein n=1 Tax=Anguilla anguilla TaxID=7936 RepID=A0A0E9UJ44_ANGAN
MQLYTGSTEKKNLHYETAVCGHAKQYSVFEKMCLKDREMILQSYRTEETSFFIRYSKAYLCIGRDALAS